MNDVRFLRPRNRGKRHNPQAVKPEMPGQTPKAPGIQADEPHAEAV
jgi:hypothetical protein